MKILLILQLLLLSKTSINAQIFDSVKYLITEAKINKVDYSQHYFENGQYLTFYKDEDDEYCLLNSMGNKEEYSYGKILGLKVKKTEEDECPAETINFRWFYHNSYNNDSGYAVVQLKRIYRENGIEFSIKILSKKLEIFEFSGFTNETVIEKEEEQNYFSKYGYIITKCL